MGLKDDILGSEDRKIQPLPIPEWKTTVYIREFSAKDRDAWESNLIRARENKSPMPENWRAMIASIVVCDEKGNRVFTDADVPALGLKSGKALDRIWDAHIQLNKLTPEEVKDYEKNS